MNQCYNSLFASVEPGSVVNWQDYFFEPSINKFADEFRASGCYQTFHLHTTLPDSLHLSEWGRSLLDAMSKVDVVYLHTNSYCHRLQLQLEQLGYKVPELRRFDLGIDTQSINESLANINHGNYHSAPGFKGLSPSQKELVHESFRSRFRVPHRFVCLDRIDPGKGVDVVIDAIDLFLAERAAHNGMDKLKESFRFFLVLDLLVEHETDSMPVSGDMKGAYVRHVSVKANALAKKYPGIVFTTGAMKGEGRALLPHMMRDCHGLTGGAQEGLNLASQEILYANRDISKTAMIGSGAGIALRFIEEGIDTQGVPILPPAKTDVWKDELHKIVDTSSQTHDAFVGSTEKVNKFIVSRNDTVIVRR